MRPTPQRFGQVVTQHGLTRCGDQTLVQELHGFVVLLRFERGESGTVLGGNLGRNTFAQGLRRKRRNIYWQSTDDFAPRQRSFKTRCLHLGLRLRRGYRRRQPPPSRQRNERHQQQPHSVLHEAVPFGEGSGTSTPRERN